MPGTNKLLLLLPIALQCKLINLQIAQIHLKQGIATLTVDLLVLRVQLFGAFQADEVETGGEDGGAVTVVYLQFALCAFERVIHFQL